MGSGVAGEFVCRVCGERHPLPLSYSSKAPADSAKVPVEEQAERVQWTPEQCVIDGKTFYMRGRIPITVHGVDIPFMWGVWVELSPKTFLRVVEMWKTHGRENEPVFTGYLNTDLPVYMSANGGSTINLEVDVKTQIVGRRHEFFVQYPKHPLAVEQRDGISMERLQEIAEAMLHPTV